jgi:RNA polymerase sigma factor (sigma-70 family)
MLNILYTYFNQISKYPLLTREQEKDLFIKIKAGDALSYNTMILCNLRLVVSIAKSYRFMEITDCIDLGNIGLIEAINEFDPSKGFKFGTYATWWIHKTIREHFYRYKYLIKQPINFYKLINAINNFNYKNQKFPTIEQLSETSGLKYKTIIASLESISTISLDSTLEDEETSLYEIIPSKNEDENDNLDINFIFSNSTLTEKEKKVIIYFFGFDEGGYQRTLDEVSDFIEGVSRERVRQIKEKALCKLKKVISKHHSAIF